MAESWNDLGDGVIMDWSDANNFLLFELWHPIEAIRRAVNERCLAAGFSPPSLISTSLKKLYSAFEIVTDIDTCVDSLIPLFVNYEDSAGDWNNKTEIPGWTEATILTQIGATGRIHPVRINNIFNIQWMDQIYKIVNELRWFKNTGLSKRGEEAKVGASTVGTNYADCKAEAEANYAASAWTASSYWGGLILNYTLGRYIPEFFPPIGPYYVGITTTRSEIGLQTQTLDFKSTADVYVNGTRSLTFLTGTQYGNKLPYLNYENKLNKIYDIFQAEAVCDGAVRWSSVKPTLDAPTEYLEPINPYDQKSVASGGILSVAVEKFDGPNGFKFRGDDW